MNSLLLLPAPMCRSSDDRQRHGHADDWVRHTRADEEMTMKSTMVMVMNARAAQRMTLQTTMKMPASPGKN